MTNVDVNEFRPFAEKARIVGALSQMIRKMAFSDNFHVEKCKDLVDQLNVLLIPRAWVGVDSERQLHLTLYVKEDAERTAQDDFIILKSIRSSNVPTVIKHAADYVWEYRQCAGTVTLVKSRNSETGQVYSVSSQG